MLLLYCRSRSLSGRQVLTTFLGPVWGAMMIRGAPRRTEACPRHEDKARLTGIRLYIILLLGSLSNDCWYGNGTLRRLLDGIRSWALVAQLGVPDCWAQQSHEQVFLMLLRKVTFNKEAALISHFSKRGGNLRNPGKPLGNPWETRGKPLRNTTLSLDSGSKTLATVQETHGTLGKPNTL